MNTYAIVGETTVVAIRDAFKYLQASVQQASWHIPTLLLIKLLHAQEHQDAHIIATEAQRHGTKLYEIQANIQHTRFNLGIQLNFQSIMQQIMFP